MIKSIKGLSSSFLKAPLEAYLRRVEGPKATLGPDEPATPASPDQTAGDELFRSMRSARKIQDRLFHLCVAVLLLLLGLHLSWLIYSAVSSDSWNWALVGGLILWPIIWALRRLWIDRVFIDMIGDLLNDFPPEEAAKVIAVIYRGSILMKGGLPELSKKSDQD